MAPPRKVPVGPRRLVRKKRKPPNHHIRVVAVRFLLIAALVAAGLKLIQVQGFEAEALAAKAERQRMTGIDLPAHRGSILDRNGMALAFSVESRSLAFQPRAQRKEIDTYNKNLKDGKVKGEPLNFDTETENMARFMAGKLDGVVSEGELLGLLRKDANFVYLVDNVQPAVAREIQEEYPSIISEYRAEREYPGKSTAANIIGVANWRTDDRDTSKHDLHGLAGLELLRDNELAGTRGHQEVATEEGNDGVVIPGTERDVRPAVDGYDLELTIDADLQYFLQQALADYVGRARARGGSAVIMDARNGEVYALANDKTFDPSTAGWDPEAMGNPAVSNAYEPGSVNKIVTALCAIDQNITSPLDVHQVNGSIPVADRVVHDAWNHGPLPLTTTGIFAKSSNVGTLMLAQECGPERFSELLKKLGIGTRTGVGLSGESPGRVPPRGQWSGSTFGNLPIGQGLMMTVLQMAGMYQAVANDGVRVPPRVVSAMVTPEGERIPEPRPEPVRVVDAKTAKTVRDMFRATVQDADTPDNGTGVPAALTGYQISGKTGTAQQFDEELGRYSKVKHWITFAGILPADDPRFVVGIMLDQPEYVGGPPEGKSAAPLFHDIASHLAQTYNIPLSKEQAPFVRLVEP
ncbi:peptidoglycan D,D-transpeptidase FtsI family protein [Actinophytocola glycyrrhizae]|uniref:Peptidoglycan D,D-transpeptidase FtsI family protein n=1 Tax=Actinophytocola glycyrrhizae TaxID=2044873 RepID=A0ABV9S634_9PSEU